MNINELVKKYITSDISLQDIVKEAIDSQSLGDTPESSPKKYQDEEEEENKS